MAEAALRLDGWQREILIRGKAGHAAPICLVGANVFINLGRMLSVIVPGRLEVVGRETHDVLQYLRIGQTQPASIHEAPHRDP